MERSEILTLLDNQRKHFNDALDRLEKNHKTTQERQEKRISDVITSLEYTQAKLDEVMTNQKQASAERKEYEKKIQELSRKNDELQQQVTNHESRMDYLDDQSRRNNLRIVGIPEEQGENWEQCQNKIAKIMKDKLNIPEANIERAHRVGKVSSQRARDIVAKFARFPEREAVFRARTKLKGTNIYINEDFCPGTVDARRQQMDDMKQARRNGKQAFFNYRTLVARDVNTGVRRHGVRQAGGAGATLHTPNPATDSSPTQIPRHSYIPCCHHRQ